MKNKKNNNKIREATPIVPAEELPSSQEGTLDQSSSIVEDETDNALESPALAIHVEKNEAPPAELDSIDPDSLTGIEPGVTSSHVATNQRKFRKVKAKTPNDIAPIKLNIEGNGDKASNKTIAISSGARRRGIAFLVVMSILVIAGIGFSLFFEGGLKEKLNSPLEINGQLIDSSEFSFMYHYILIENGVDIFGANTREMLSSPSGDPNFPTNRDYFLNLTASEIQTIQILYDDAISKGYEIEEDDYELSRAYIDWLGTKAAELNISLDTYIRGVFGNQVDEHVVLRVLSKKYFTERYSTGAKLIELQASSEQAEEAYNLDRNSYDVVDYKILHITYEQREQAFIDTANLHAQEIITAMAGDISRFELCASEYFSGEAKNRLMNNDSTLVSDARYDDFSHDDIRDWLWDPQRVPGDATIISDSDGFPIIIAFAQRNRQQVPLRDVRMVHINIDEANGLGVSEAQALAQEIYDSASSPNDIQSVENTYNDYVINGSIEVIHSSDTYPGKYEGILGEWIFSSERQADDKAFLDTANGYYIVYMVNISEQEEWYDRVNSFIRMNNYQAFMNEQRASYEYHFIQSGVDEIMDVP